MLLKEFIKELTPWLKQNEKIYRLYEKSNNWNKKNNIYMANYYSYKLYRKFNCIISPKAQIGKGLTIPHPSGIVIGEEAVLGKNVVIYQNVTIGRKNRDIPEYPIIGNNVVIYANSTIVGDVKIGNDAVIGCNSVVLRDVKDGEVVCGIVE